MGCIRSDQYNPLIHDIISVHDTEAGCNEDCGVCCLPDGTCVDNTQSACAAAGGLWNAGVTCEDVICPSPSPSPSPSLSTPPSQEPSQSPSPTPTPPPPTCNCYRIDISSNGSTSFWQNVNGTETSGSTYGDSVPCNNNVHNYIAYAWPVYGAAITCLYGEFSGTFVIAQQAIGGSPAYFYYFNVDGTPNAGWVSGTLYPIEECLNVDVPTPTITITRASGC